MYCGSKRENGQHGPAQKIVHGLNPGFKTSALKVQHSTTNRLFFTFVFFSQEPSSSTPVWPCWASSSSTVVCRRPKAGVWRKSRLCLKTSCAPAAPQIQTKGGRSSTFESKVQTTTCRTMTHLTWTNQSSGVGHFTLLECFVRCTGTRRGSGSVMFLCVSLMSIISKHWVQGIQKWWRQCCFHSTLKVKWRENWSWSCFRHQQISPPGIQTTFNFPFFFSTFVLPENNIKSDVM